MYNNEDLTNDIIVVDDVLSKENHQALYPYIKDIKMWNGWTANDGRYDGTWHWNYTFNQPKQFMPSMDEEDYHRLKTEHPLVYNLWLAVEKIVQEKVCKVNPLRIYMNCTSYGTNAYAHTDDGDFTVVYYPNLFWDSEWEGGTCFYDRDENDVLDARQYVSCRPNRLVLFRGNIIHRAMPVDRYCKVPRYCIAFKLQRDVNDPSYVKSFYGKNNG